MGDSEEKKKMNEGSTLENEGKIEKNNEISQEEPNEIAINDVDCSDLNAENNTEGVLVETIENEFESEDLEQKTTESTTINPNISMANKNNNNNNISLCNTQDAENIDDNSLLVGVSHDESGIYDDVMTGPDISASEFRDVDLEIGSRPGSNDGSQNSVKNESNTNSNLANKSEASKSFNSQIYVKRVSCYVGNLTWWTSDKDLTEAITSLGITDLLEIKFYENKINGQSKGFAMVTSGSDESFRTLMSKLPKKEINSQEPLVTPFSRHYFNQFEEQARRDMPSTAGNNGNTEGGSGGGGGGGGSHHHNSGSYQNLRNNNDNHFHGHNPHNNNSHHHNNSSHQNSGQFNQNMMNRNNHRFPSNNPNMPAGGLLGQGPRPNGMMHAQRPGLVGNYQPRHPTPNNMNNISQGQSIMGMNNPMNNISLQRPNFNGPNSNFINNNRGNHGNMNPHQPQSGLMGNRPPLVPSNPSSLPGMRHGLNPALLGQGQGQGLGQGVGLLNNPRVPLNNHNNQGNMPQQPRSDWERQNSGQMNNSNQFGSNGHFSNQAGNSNSMSMPMNQNQNQNSLGNRLGPVANSFHGINTNAGQMTGQGQNPSQNGILPNPPNLQPFQQSQNHLQPNFQHPHSQNPQPQGFGNPQLNPQQQPHIQHPSQMGQQPGQHLLNGPNGQIGHLNQGGNNHNANSHPQISQDSFYSHQNQQRPDLAHSQAQSLGLHPHPHHLTLPHQPHTLNDIEFQEAFEKNRIVSSSAITRAVQDASIGQYPSAIETLRTAISLIKQSKISNDERCKLFMISLQDTKKGIEDKYYGMTQQGRSMSGGGGCGGGGGGVEQAHMIDPNNGMQLQQLSSSGHNQREGESRDRERLKRSRSRDSRDRRGDRGERERSERGERSRRGSDKHHRSSHRERSSRDRSPRETRRTVQVTNSNNNGMQNMENMEQNYYDEPMQSQSSRYHRSRH